MDIMAIKFQYVYLYVHFIIYGFIITTQTNIKSEYKKRIDVKVTFYNKYIFIVIISKFEDLTLRTIFH